ncbi:serine/threonine-protein kinase SMG1-like isoform X2 [Corticium candelabrum]|uniref:serine/threonine-protein kinase SMG1-like isoform X2 n=1 Tax=Corticium candelabrum TaxID=121492 RepID=UPI002E32A9B9|nr:serine/threonine-protein kinase SMG1-like isoform X2 [Corticium candelabrum]
MWKHQFLTPLVTVLSNVAKNYPHCFGPHFKDVVDILIGWHIDTSQAESLAPFISTSLVAMHHFWVADLAFSVNLISQFLEDVESYSRELASLVTDGREMSPEQCQSKVTALLGVLSTVVKAIGKGFLLPNVGTAVSEEYIADIVQRVIQSTELSNSSYFDEDVYIAANDCLSSLAGSLKSYFGVHCVAIVSFVNNQFVESPLTCITHMTSVIALIRQIVKSVGNNIPPTFVQRILQSASPFLTIRRSHSEKLLHGIMDCLNDLLALSSKTVQAATYEAVVSDLSTVVGVIQAHLKTNVSCGHDGKSVTGVSVSEMSLSEAEGLVIFDLHVLRTVIHNSSSQKTSGPSVQPSSYLLNILTQEWCNDTQLAVYCPQAHYGLVYTLLELCDTQGGLFRLGHQEVTSVMNVISSLASNRELVLDTKLLTVKWLSQSLQPISQDKQSSSELDSTYDHLASALLSSAFDREREVRLETAHCLKKLLQCRLVSEDIQQKCVQECVLKLTDTDGNVRGAFVTVLENLSPEVIISYCHGQWQTVSEFQHSSESVAVGNFVYKSWLARRAYCSRPPTGRFQAHHFQAIMNFLLKAVTPSRHVNDDWLERLYHSCQQCDNDKEKESVADVSLGSKANEKHFRNSVDGCDALLWFWSLWELARFVILSKIRTPLGGPQETFQAIGNTVRSYYLELKEGIEQSPLTSTAVGKGTGVGPKYFTRNLRVNLLVMFMDHLEKHIYNADCGCAIALQPSPKNIRSFFRTNSTTCSDWLNRLRLPLATIALHCGSPSATVKHCYEKLAVITPQDSEFEQLLVVLASALCRLRASEALAGVSMWVREKCGRSLYWLDSSISVAKGCYEQASKGLRKCWDRQFDSYSLPSSPKFNDMTKKNVSTVVTNYLANQLLDCYVNLSAWNEVIEFIDVCEQMQEDGNSQQSVTLQYDVNYIRALQMFDDSDMKEAQKFLNLAAGADADNLKRFAHGGEKVDCDLGCKPLWNPHQMLHASQRQLLRALVLLTGNHHVRTASGGDEGLNTLDASECSDVDDEGTSAGSSVESDVRTLNRVKKLLRQASAYSEVHLRVSALGWPPLVSVQHAAQLQCSAAVQIAIQERAEQVSDRESNSSLLPLRPKCFTSSLHDAGLAAHLLRVASFLGRRNYNIHAHTVHNITLSSARLARKQSNFNLARRLLLSRMLDVHGFEVSHQPFTDDADDEDIADVLSSVTLSEGEDLLSIFQIQHEGAKLLNAVGQNKRAIEMLCYATSAVFKMESYSRHPFADPFARSLLTLSKWLQSDQQLAVNALSPDSPSYSSLTSLVANKRSWHFEIINGANLHITSGLSDVDSLPGLLLSLATDTSPGLAKAWANYAAWCYRWGRRTVEQLSSMGTVELLPDEKSNALLFLPDEATKEQIKDVLRVLGQAHFKSIAHQEELTGVDQLRVQFGSSSARGGADGIQQQLLQSCPSLASGPAARIDQLLKVWKDVCSRLFSHYRMAAKAYFRYLQLSGEADKRDVGSSSHSLRELNVIATLRLLRLLVKHAEELRVELAGGFNSTPTEPWKAIIPQLLSRLSHPDVNVRHSVTELVRRIAVDCPYLVIYPAVVSCPLPGGADSKQQRGNEQLLRSISRMDSLTATNYGGEEHTAASAMEDFVSVEILDNLPMAKAAAAEASRSNVEGDGDQEEEEEDDEVTKEKQEEMTTLQGCFRTILETISEHCPRLVVDVQHFVQELKRIRLLWEELWLGALAHRQPDVSRRLQQLEAEVKRVQDNSTLKQDEKMKIMTDKHLAIMRPVLVALEKIHEFTSQPPETPHEEWFQKTYSKMLEKAFDALRNPDNPRKPRHCWAPFKEFHQNLYQRSQKRASMALKMSNISPKLAQTKNSFICMPGVTASVDDHKDISVESFVDDVLILPTKTRPKKFTVCGYDGHRHSYLFKGLEDMHLDERIMQFLGIINTMFAHAERCEDPHFKARHYAVTPLGIRSGLVKWVDRATPLFSIYKRWQQREALMQSTRVATLSTSLTASHVSPPLAGSHPQHHKQQNEGILAQRPSEQYFSKLKPLLSEKGISADVNNRKQWPLAVMRQMLDELIAETPGDLLAKELWCASTGSAEWWGMTQTYARSTAVMSIVGYIIGLGDRHLDNLMIDLATGEVVHIDYNVCFEKGRILRVPEKVSFRLTENIKTAFGLTGVEGTFRLSCEQVLKTLRRGRETLLTLLEAFVYDPLVDWTTGNDEIFTAEQTVDRAEKAQLSDKKEMERGITQTMLSSRVAEMRAEWKKNKADVANEFQQLLECVDKILSLQRLQTETTKRINRLQLQIKLMQEVVTVGTNHPVFHAQARYDAHQRLSCEQADALRISREKKADSERWQAKHEHTLSRLYANELTTLQSDASHDINIEQSGCLAATDFLTKTGQGHLIVQCSQAHDELLQELTKCRSVVTSCLTSLELYERIISHYSAAKFIAGNRSREWQQLFDSLLSQTSSLNCAKVYKAYCSCHPVDVDVSCSPAVRAKLLAVHRDLHLSLVEENTKLAKLSERQPSNTDIAALDHTAQSNNTTLRRLLTTVPHAPASLTCIVTSALATLNTRWLMMEKTAMNAGNRLHELISRNGDWFLDELLTMSLNVTQMVELLHIAPMNEAAGKASAEGFQVVVATTSVYETLQELVHKVQSSVAPQLLQALLADEPGLDEVLECLETANKAMTDQQARQELTTGFGSGGLHADLLTDLARESYVELLQSSSGVYAQVLNILDQLFGAVEYGLADLYECVHQQVPIPPQYIDIPLVKEATTLSAHRSGGGFMHSFTADSMISLKLQCVTSFFKRCQQYAFCLKSATQPETPKDLVLWLQFCASIGAAALAGGPVSGSSVQVSNRRLNVEFLLLPVREFVSGCILQHLVGLPSESLASGLLHFLPTLGANIEDIVMKARPAVGSDGVSSSQVTLELLAQKTIEWNIHTGNVTRPSLNSVGRAIRELDGAWRKVDIAKRLENNADLTRTNIANLQLHLAQFQWLHEDLVVATKAHHGVGMTQPARNSVMSELRKQCSALQQSNMSVMNAHEKLRNQENTVIQRLRWAAASNPSLATVMKDIESSQVSLKMTLESLTELPSDVLSMVETVLHFEAHRTQTPESVAADRSVVSLLERLQKSTRALEEHAQTLEDARHLLKTIEPTVGSLPRPLTMQWIQTRLQDIHLEKVAEESKIQEAKSDVKKQTLSFPDYSRRLLAAWKMQSNLLHEVSKMLESMTEYEKESGVSGSGVSVSTYLEQQTEFACDLKEFTDHMRNVTQTETLGDYSAIHDVAAGLLTKAQWLHDQLLALTGQTEGGSEMANQLMLPPQVNTKLVKGGVAKEPSITIITRNTDIKSVLETETEASEREPSATRPLRGRDPRTGKALQERNTYAVNVWRRVKAKLEGRDIDPNKRMSVVEQVDFVIQEATNKDNLCVMYEGWTPWV